MVHGAFSEGVCDPGLVGVGGPGSFLHKGVAEAEGLKEFPPLLVVCEIFGFM